mgnify:CR=1 FL=1
MVHNMGLFIAAISMVIFGVGHAAFSYSSCKRIERMKNPIPFYKELYSQMRITIGGGIATALFGIGFVFVSFI